LELMHKRITQMYTLALWVIIHNIYIDISTEFLIFSFKIPDYLILSL
jgi:hypothetical protein